MTNYTAERACSLIVVTPLLQLLLTPIAQADQSVSYTYNAQGQIATIDGPRVDVNDITTFNYDPQGNRIQTTNALGHITQITAYDLSGRPLTIIDPNGTTTELGYDARGWLTSRNTAGRLTQYAYDPAGNVQQITLADGQIITYHYDQAHRSTGYSDALGNRVSYTLDNAGNRTDESITDPNSVLTRSHQYVYDELSQLINDTGGEGQYSQYGYGVSRNRTLQMDSKGNPTTFSYDALNRLIDTTDANSGSTLYSYDARDNLTSVTDPNGHITTYSYDAFDNLIQQQSPDTGTTTFTYDDAGNLKTKTDAKGQLFNYSYDALNRLTLLDAPGMEDDISYSYDSCNNGVGRLCSVTMGENGSSPTTITYSYNAFGEVTTHQSIGYSYDNAGRLQNITYPSGAVVTYGYDAAGQINDVQLTQPGQATTTLAGNINYHPFGPLSTLQYGNGLGLSQIVDSAYRASGISAGIALDLSGIQYDANDNLALRNSNGVAESYGYDNLNRLETADGAFGTRGYQYDANGNRLEREENGVLTPYSYEPGANRMAAIDDVSIALDANGNTLGNGNQTYAYSVHNRLVEASDTTGLLGQYRYNGLGQRTSKTSNSETINYTYGLNGELLVEFNTANQSGKEYIYLGDRLLAMLSANQSQTTNIYHFEGQSVNNTDAAMLDVDIDAKSITLTAPNFNFQYTFSDRGWREYPSDTAGKRFVGFAYRVPNSYDFFRGKLTLRDGGVSNAIIIGFDAPERYAYYNLRSNTDNTGYIGTSIRDQIATLQIDETTQRIALNEQGYPQKIIDISPENWRVSSWVGRRFNGAPSTIDVISFSAITIDGLEISGKLTTRNGVKSGRLTVSQGAGNYYYYRMTGGKVPAVTTDALYFIHSDHLGTPQSLTDESGHVVWNASYDPFGQASVNEDVDGDGQAVAFNLRFPGQYFDQETGLHYNYFRTYDPSTGRYITSDPIGLEGGLNTYGYVGGNPVNRVDPLGLYWDCYPELGCIWVDTRPYYTPPDPNRTCVTAECAAGLPPVPSNLTPQSELDCKMCTFVCNLSTSLFPTPFPTSWAAAAQFGGTAGASFLSCQATCSEECSQPDSECKK